MIFSRSGIIIVPITLFIFSLNIMTTFSISIEKSDITLKNHDAHSSLSPSSSPLSAGTLNTLTDFNFAAVGDWGCTSDTTNTLKNIQDKNPEFVLVLGDLSYDKSTQCWFDIIDPIAEKIMSAIGNHEVDSTKKLQQYMDYFGLEE